MDHPKRVALFGGTFDPVHLGHLAIARAARERLHLDRVLFIPCRQSPHKDNPALAGNNQRIHMLELALAAEPWALVSGVELQFPSPSSSWITAEAMAEIYPRSQLFWLMGADQWSVIESWSRPEHLAGIVDFIVHDRDGLINPRTGFRTHFISGSHPASAHEIRSRAPDTLPAEWLHPAVADFIRSCNLYGCRS